MLYGKAGAGKTQYALHYFNSTALLVSEIEDLKLLRPQHTGIVFDDITLGPDGEDMSPEDTIHILDLECRRSTCITVRL